MMDSDTGRSKGYGFITVSPGQPGPQAPHQLLIRMISSLPAQFADAECGKKALEQLNGFELAGRPMKVGHVTERSDSSVAPPFLDGEEQERSCSDPGNPGRLQLMGRLSEGENFSLHLQKTNDSFPS